MKRLFTFGCSFTSYPWPTWADILGKTFEHYENWGQSGAGNQYIFNSLIECNTRNRLTADDTVIIMWTNVAREDRYVNESWLTPGNIYTQVEYDAEFVKKFSDDRGYLIRDFATISATIDLLDKWGVNYDFLSMVPLDNVDQYLNKKSSKDQDVIDLYSDIFKKIKPSVYEIIFNFDYHGHFKNHRPPEFFRDFHPLPSEHLKYLQAVLPEYQINDELKQWVADINTQTLSDSNNSREQREKYYWRKPYPAPPLRL